MQATIELRFIIRSLGVGLIPLRILQQRWVRIGTLHSEELTDKNSEWRDVPLVEEPADARK